MSHARRKSIMSAESRAPQKPHIDIPPELLAAVQPHEALRPRNHDIESFKPSLLGRVAAYFLPKRR
jgi:hypothetical protein